MKKFKKLILVLVLFLFIQESKSQQLPIFSQYMFNDYVINPGVAGTLDYIPLRMTYRNQWTRGDLVNSGEKIALVGSSM